MSGHLKKPALRLCILVLLSYAVNYALLGLMYFNPAPCNNGECSREMIALKSSSEMIAHPSSPLMVAIICDSTSLSTLGPVVMDSWAKAMPYDFRFFVGEDSASIPEALEKYTIQLAAPDGYPPRKKELTMFKYLHDNFGQYSWYMKVDIDSYLNVNELEKIVKKLLASGSTEGYIGSPGIGREFERASLGLNGSFCMGFGYLMGRETLGKLRLELDWCMANPHSQHSDTEIGNCVYKASKATCQKMGQFVNYYFSYGADGLVTNAKVTSNSTNQQVHSSQAVFFGTPLEAVLVHALKKPSDMQNLHMQLIRNLRPTIPAPRVLYNNISYPIAKRPKEGRTGAEEQAVNFLSNACVNNPLVQMDSTGFILPECEPVAVQHSSSFIKPDISAIPAYVLNLAHRKERYKSLAKSFSELTSLNVMRFEAINGNELYAKGWGPLKPGEQGYRMTMRALFAKALQDDTKLMLILDDDAIPHNDFDKHFMNILNDNRCGSHFFSDHEGGVLQLGGTVHFDDVWKLIEGDLARARKQSGHEPLCFNSHLKVYGSFAVLYHRNTFQEIIDWIDHGPVQPYDWSFGWLAMKGYVTRVASPYLFIPDVSKVSDVDANRKSSGMSVAARAKIHRWKLDNFNKSFDMTKI